MIGVRGEDGTVQYPMFNVQDCASSVEYIDPNSEWFFQLCGDTKPSCDPEPVAEVRARMIVDNYTIATFLFIVQYRLTRRFS